MKRTRKLLGETALVLVGCLAFAALVILALALRIAYETFMLPVRVWRAECRAQPL